jgi:hypothetical protein
MLDQTVLDAIQPFNGVAPVPSDAGQIIAGGGAMQQVKTSYTTAVAVQKPRSISRVANNVLQEASLAGAAFYYRWEVWDKKKKEMVPIQGPSIDLAMCIARNFGNCVIDIEAQETPSHYMIKGILIDLETGFTCPRLFRQRKSQGLGKFDQDRQEDILFQIGQSKAVRNAIVHAMPSWLLDKAIETAQAAELASIKPENIHIARTRVISFFSKYGADPERIEAKIGRPADAWTPQDIVDLRGMATGLKEGRVSVDELFPPVAAEQPPEGAEPAAANAPSGLAASAGAGASENKPAGERSSDPAPWDPLKAEVQQRYPADKAAILKETAEKCGLNVKGKLPKEVHQLLLQSAKGDREEIKPQTQGKYTQGNPDLARPPAKTGQQVADETSQAGDSTENRPGGIDDAAMSKLASYLSMKAREIKSNMSANEIFLGTRRIFEDAKNTSRIADLVIFAQEQPVDFLAEIAKVLIQEQQPKAKSSGEDERSLCHQYKRQWSDLWKMGAKNKGIDPNMSPNAFTPEQCIAMANEIEGLVELQRRHGEDEKF